MNLLCSILLAVSYISTPAKAAHRLTDNQILDVINSAPSGASVTVPADFFRDVIAGKYRWRNATNWIARASGDPTMVTALDSMHTEMTEANAENAATQKKNRHLEEEVISLTNEIAVVVMSWEDKYRNATNMTEFVKSQLAYQKELTEQVKRQVAAAVERLRVVSSERDDYKDELTNLKTTIQSKRDEYQEKYEKGTVITKPIYKAIVTVFDKLLDLFDAVGGNDE